MEDVFLVIFILNMDREPNVVEFFILGPSMARLALSRMARQRMVGSAITPTAPESRTDQYKETCTETSERKGLNCFKVTWIQIPFVVLRTSQIVLFCLAVSRPQMTLKPGMTSGHSKVTSFIAITLNLENNSTCRRKRHSQVHRNT